MKKSFVCLIAVLVLVTMLCACGMEENDGVIGSSPKPSDSVDIMPSTVPEVETSMLPSIEPSAKVSPEIKSPQVGETNNAKASAEPSDSSKK